MSGPLMNKASDEPPRPPPAMLAPMEDVPDAVITYSFGYFRLRIRFARLRDQVRLAEYWRSVTGLSLTEICPEFGEPAPAAATPRPPIHQGALNPGICSRTSRATRSRTDCVAARLVPCGARSDI